MTHLQIIVVVLKNNDLLQILLKCGFRVVHTFLTEQCKNLFFSLRLFGCLSCNSIKTC